MKVTPFSLFDKLIDLSFIKYGLELCQVDLGEYIMEYWISKEDKPVIVLLHAFGPNGKYSWRKQVKILSKDYKILIPNLIYFGNSTIKNKSYHVSDQVEAISSLFKYLKINNFILGGTSYGGVIAFELLYMKTFVIKKLFITNSPIKYVLDDNWEKIIDDFGVNRKSDVLIPDNYKNLKKLYDISNYKKKHFPKFIFKDVFKKLYTYQAQERRLLIDTFIDDQKYLNKRIYKIDIPILLVWGEKDNLSPLRTAVNLKKHLGENVRLAIVPKTGHMPHVERKSVFNKILLDFISI